MGNKKWDSKHLPPSRRRVSFKKGWLKRLVIKNHLLNILTIVLPKRHANISATANVLPLERANKMFDLRRQSDKYLALPPDDASIAREIYYRVHSRRRLLSKFQPNRTRSFVLTACGSRRVRGF